MDEILELTPTHVKMLVQSMNLVREVSEFEKKCKLLQESVDNLQVEIEFLKLEIMKLEK